MRTYVQLKRLYRFCSLEVILFLNQTQPEWHNKNVKIRESKNSIELRTLNELPILFCVPVLLRPLVTQGLGIVWNTKSNWD